jgi:hypothetical protein
MGLRIPSNATSWWGWYSDDRYILMVGNMDFWVVDEGKCSKE